MDKLIYFKKSLKDLQLNNYNFDIQKLLNELNNHLRLKSLKTNMINYNQITQKIESIDCLKIEDNSWSINI